MTTKHCSGHGRALPVNEFAGTSVAVVILAATRAAA
jgi:hypothetical protein